MPTPTDRRFPAVLQSCVVFLALVVVTQRRALGQDVNGVSLGQTTVSTLLQNRSDTTATGKNVNGWQYLSFGTGPTYTYYFSPEDSIIDWARVFVTEGYTAGRVHEAFGKPDTTEYAPDLSKHESFKKGQVFVSYKPDGTVAYVEYHATISIGLRRQARANRAIDSLMAAVLIRAHPELTDSLANDSVLFFTAGALVVESWNNGLYRKTAPKPAMLHAASRYQNLCALIGCDSILTANRAGDGTP